MIQVHKYQVHIINILEYNINSAFHSTELYDIIRVLI